MKEFQKIYVGNGMICPLELKKSGLKNGGTI